MLSVMWMSLFLKSKHACRKMPSCYKSDSDGVSGCMLLPTQEIEVHLAKAPSSVWDPCLGLKKKKSPGYFSQGLGIVSSSTSWERLELLTSGTAAP